MSSTGIASSFMMFFRSSYSGIFRDRANRKACFIDTSAVEVLDKIIYAGIGAIEISPSIKTYFRTQVSGSIILLILYALLSNFHFALLKTSKLLWLQFLFTTIVKVALVLLLLALLSLTETESWTSTGLVSLVLITIIVIKLIDIVIAYFNLVDMCGNWSYLIEFGLGVMLIATMLVILLLANTGLPLATVLIALAIGVFFSLVSLLDLHQNMKTNWWWWEERIMRGALYHVFRQYTMLWCVRIEQKPPLIREFEEDHRLEQRNATDERTEPFRALRP